jgi:hypothetical protein
LSLSKLSLAKARHQQQSSGSAVSQHQNHVWSARSNQSQNQAPKQPKRRADDTPMGTSPLRKPRRKNTAENMFKLSVDSLLMNAAEAAGQTAPSSAGGFSMGPPLPRRRMSNEQETSMDLP